mmetsp:Transcript_11793/g.18510  ORF Transcript_11793/g.18510 Transcript_11793/m.18510 type:complete len:247 (+) Transcript_11793:1354-2094(+)
MTSLARAAVAETQWHVLYPGGLWPTHQGLKCGPLRTLEVPSFPDFYHLEFQLAGSCTSHGVGGVDSSEQQDCQGCWQSRSAKPKPRCLTKNLQDFGQVSAKDSSEGLQKPDCTGLQAPLLPLKEERLLQSVRCRRSSKYVPHVPAVQEAALCLLRRRGLMERYLPRIEGSHHALEAVPPRDGQEGALGTGQTHWSGVQGSAHLRMFPLLLPPPFSRHLPSSPATNRYGLCASRMHRPCRRLVLRLV